MLLHATTLCIIRYEAPTHHQAHKDGELGADCEAEAAGATQTGVSGLRTSESPACQSLRPEDTGDSGPPSGLTPCTGPWDNLKAPPEAGPETDRNLRPRPESPVHHTGVSGPTVARHEKAFGPAAHVPLSPSRTCLLFLKYPCLSGWPIYSPPPPL